MANGTRPDGQIFASGAADGELENFPAETRGWGVTLDGKSADGEIVTDATNGIPPMEWMNGILNKLSNQIFWNMQNAIPVWSSGIWGGGAFVTYSGWVYYNNSGEDSADTPDVGSDWIKLIPLVDIDGRYLQISKNFSEIAASGTTAQSESRANIGCGTAAAANVVTSDTDSTAGRTPVVGWMGLGGTGLSFGNDATYQTGRDVFNYLIDNYQGSCFVRCNYIPGGDTVDFATDSPGIWFREGDTCAYIQCDYKTGITFVMSGNTTKTIFSANTLYGTANPPPQPDLSPYETTTDVDAKLKNYETVSDANSRFIQGLQLGATGSMDSPDDGATTDHIAPGGCALVGLTTDETPSGGADNVKTIYYKPIQGNLNGNWYTING